MTFLVADRVQETTNSPGTGTATLLGAVSGYQSFSTGIGANNTTFYVIADQLGTNWEVGLGALNSTGTQLTRTTVYSSSNGGSTVNFATGTQYVWCDFPSSKSVIQGTAVNFSDLTYTSTLTGGTGVVNLGSGQFYKDASGNVGIGTSSPTSKLSIQTASGTATTLVLNQSSTGAGQLRIPTSVNALAFDYYNGSTLVEGMRLDSSGNVGIGTTTPSTGSFNKQLTINSGASTYAGIVLQNNTTGSAYNDGVQIATDSTNALIYNYEAGNMIFYNNVSERMRIDSSGNLLVGTTGVISLGLSNFYVANGVNKRPIETKVNTTASADHIAFFSSAGEAGQINVTNLSTAYNTSSDYRLKDNIEPMTGALDTVAKLKPVTYNWKSDGSNGQGFIAHELQSVVPDCVTGEKDAVDAEDNPVYQGIDTSFLVATLTAAIQEQQALITSLTTRLTALENK